jgi:Tol biopolymer transport system component
MSLLEVAMAVMVVLILTTGCAGAVLPPTPMLPSATPVPPTATAVPPASPAAPMPTSTSMPSPTPAPTPWPTLSGNGGGVIALAGVKNDETGAIYLMNADGSGLHPLSSSAAGWGLAPAWSPDGKRIAFYYHRNNDAWSIYIVDADGSNEQQLTNARTRDNVPDWSPDGKQIAFCRDGDIWVMRVSSGPNAQVSDLRPLTSTPKRYDSSPDWSPDGTQIAFVVNLGGPRVESPDFDRTTAEIYVMNADGTNLRQLTHDKFADYGPAWSPDGKRIAFESNHDGNDQIYVMDSDGRNIQRLTNNNANDISPVWSPDGTRIAFSSDRDGNSEIYVMNANGSNQTRLTKTAMDNWHPTWKRGP